MEQSPVSVVIPTYNRAALLRAALASVLAQTLSPREIAVVDDGSTDDTAALIAELIAAGAPLVYLPGPHANRRGPARNRGAAATTAPLIAFLDSDDLWLPERLARQVAALDAAPGAGWAFCNLQRFDEHGPFGPPFLPAAADYSGPILGALLEEPLVLSSTLLVRRTAFERVGGFADLRMNEDYELTLRLALDGPATYLAEPLARVRQHAGRTSFSHAELPLLDYLTIVEQFLAAHPNLPPGVRVRARRGLANVHFKLARYYLEQGAPAPARGHLYALLRLRPWDRRAPGAYLRAWSLSVRRAH